MTKPCCCGNCCCCGMRGCVITAGALTISGSSLFFLFYMILAIINKGYKELFAVLLTLTLVHVAAIAFGLVLLIGVCTKTRACALVWFIGMLVVVVLSFGFSIWLWVIYGDSINRSSGTSRSNLQAELALSIIFQLGYIGVMMYFLFVVYKYWEDMGRGGRRW